MAKYVNDLAMDAALDFIAAGNIINVCNAQPANRTEATSTYNLATKALNANDFAKADGNSSGRKVTVAAQNNLTVGANGNATHIAICNATLLLLVTTCTSQTLSSGNTVSIPAFADEIADAA